MNIDDFLTSIESYTAFSRNIINLSQNLLKLITDIKDSNTYEDFINKNNINNTYSWYFVYQGIKKSVYITAINEIFNLNSFLEISYSRLQTIKIDENEQINKFLILLVTILIYVILSLYIYLLLGVVFVLNKEYKKIEKILKKYEFRQNKTVRYFNNDQMKVDNKEIIQVLKPFLVIYPTTPLNEMGEIINNLFNTFNFSKEPVYNILNNNVYFMLDILLDDLDKVLIDDILNKNFNNLDINNNYKSYLSKIIVLFIKRFGYKVRQKLRGVVEVDFIEYLGDITNEILRDVIEELVYGFRNTLEVGGYAPVMFSEELSQKPSIYRLSKVIESNIPQFYTHPSAPTPQLPYPTSKIPLYYLTFTTFYILNNNVWLNSYYWLQQKNNTYEKQARLFVYNNNNNYNLQLIIPPNEVISYINKQITTYKTFSFAINPRFIKTYKYLTKHKINNKEYEGVFVIPKNSPDGIINNFNSDKNNNMLLTFVVPVYIDNMFENNGIIKDSISSITNNINEVIFPKTDRYVYYNSTLEVNSSLLSNLTLNPVFSSDYYSDEDLLFLFKFFSILRITNTVGAINLITTLDFENTILDNLELFTVWDEKDYKTITINEVFIPKYYVENEYYTLHNFYVINKIGIKFINEMLMNYNYYRTFIEDNGSYDTKFETPFELEIELQRIQLQRIVY